MNRLTTLLSKENISLPLNEWALENVDKEPTRLILWALDELTQNYNSEKVIDKIISYDYSGKYRYTVRSEIRKYLNVNEEYEEYDNYAYFNYWQSWEYESWIDVAWFSKLYEFNLYDEKLFNQKIKLELDGKKYEVDLSEYVDELLEKADWKDRSEPALYLEWDDYRLVISGFYWKKDDNLNPHFSNVQWYILIK